VSKAFTARRVEQLRPRARQVAVGLLDDVMAAGPPADLVQNFSFAFPAIVICELLGIPKAERRQFRSWTDAMVSTSTISPEAQQELYLNLLSYFGRLFAERRERPGTDLLTGLVQARDNEERLTETELLVLGTALLVAGYETSAHQITNMVHTLLTHPRQLEQLRASPQLIPGAVEEMLRYITRRA
jgi:cytochrome P450